jgi:hypothetical protein
MSAAEIRSEVDQLRQQRKQLDELRDQYVAAIKVSPPSRLLGVCADLPRENLPPSSLCPPPPPPPPPLGLQKECEALVAGHQQAVEEWHSKSVSALQDKIRDASRAHKEVKQLDTSLDEAQALE